MSMGPCHPSSLYPYIWHITAPNFQGWWGTTKWQPQHHMVHYKIDVGSISWSLVILHKVLQLWSNERAKFWANKSSIIQVPSSFLLSSIIFFLLKHFPSFLCFYFKYLIFKFTNRCDELHIVLILGWLFKRRVIFTCDYTFYLNYCGLSFGIT